MEVNKERDDKDNETWVGPIKTMGILYGFATAGTRGGLIVDG
jgi:hypothetical protein